MTAHADCIFCKIVAYQEPARFRYIDDDIVVIVNRLTWVPVMLLVMPKEHLSQVQLWSSPILNRLGDVAVQMGCDFCPNGFRVLSNFGRDGMQSQSHGHLHVVGGTRLIEYA